MSIQKKNKGRAREAQANDNPVSRLVQKFTQMEETDFSKSVVIPVLESQGYIVDFHHGNTEVGKDLIFYREKGFGQKSLIVAVVKMDRLSKSASDPSGFPTVLVQSAQAINNEVLSWDGARRRPDELFIIFADDPSHDILTSSPDHFRQTLAHGVTFIRGSEIATELLSKRPEIAEQLLESKLDTSQFLRHHPTNLPLLHALNSNELIDVGTIFTDLDAAVGTTSVSEAFFLRPSTTVSRICVAEPSWDLVAGAIKQMEELLGPLLVQSLVEQEKIHSARNAKAKAKSNIDLRRKLEGNVAEILNWIQGARLEFGARATAISAQAVTLGKREHKAKAGLAIAFDTANELRNDSKPLEDELLNFGRAGRLVDNLSAILGLLDKYRSHLSEAIDPLKEIGEGWVEKDDPADARITVFIEVQRTIARQLDTAEQFLSERQDLVTKAKSVIQPEDYEITFNMPAFTARLSGHVDSLVSRFSSPQVATDKDYAKRLLDDTRRYLIAVDSFIRNKELSHSTNPWPSK